MLDGLLMLGNIHGFPNRELEKKIKLFLKENTQSNYLNLISELEESEFLFIMESFETNPTGFVVINVNNKKYLPLFSSEDEFSKIKFDIELNYNFNKISEISEIIKREQNNFLDGIIIDPKGLNMIIDRELLKKR